MSIIESKQVNRCKKCGKEFFGNSTGGLCSDCYSKEEEKRNIVRQYVIDHQGASFDKVVEETGVSDKFLRNMMSNGFFAANKKRECKRCGKVIKKGLYCSNCLTVLRDAAKRSGTVITNIKNSVAAVKEQQMNENYILIIDDDELYLDMAKVILERKLPCKVLTANNGLKGIELMRKNAIKLVLLDIVMPLMDGLKTLELIRDNARFKDIPVIMLTASTKREDVTRAASLGVTDYVSKPFIPDQLIGRVNKNLHLIKEDPKQLSSILLIDDDILDSRKERKILERALACNLVIVPSGAEGMQELKESRFDLVLVSLDMPFIDGLEIVQFIRNDEEIKHLPIVIMVNSNDENTLNRINDSEANAYVVKPEFSDEDLKKIINLLR